MTWEMGVVFAVVVAALVLFITERYPVDQVALGIPVVLLATGILTPEEAVSGFSNTATVTVALMLLLSLGLIKTGAVAAIGRWARTARLGGPYTRMIVLCLIAAVTSAFLNNTAVVVVFLPVFIAVAQQAQQPASQWLMPLSFAAILGGTVTLIGTSTNLVVYGMAKSRGYDLTMFSIAPLGLVYLAIGLTYLFTVGRVLLPRRTGQVDLSGKYGVRDFMAELRVTRDTPAAGRTYADAQWGQRYGVSVLGLYRDGRTIWGPIATRRILPGDLLYAQGTTDDLLRLVDKERLETPAKRLVSSVALGFADARLAEVLVAPAAPIVGHTLKESRFQQRYDATVLALQHHGRTVRDRLAEVRLEPGDLLLVHGTVPALEALAQTEGFVPLSEIVPPRTDRPRALVAVAILLGVVITAGAGILDIMPAALIGGALMLFTRCVRLEEVYEDMDWMVVFLLAGAIPLGVAMDKSGAAAWLAGQAAEAFGPHGPTAVVAAFYLLTSLLTSIMSNNATAVVMTPIALGTAADLGLNPYALLVAVMFGASADFSTPIGYQTNTLIYGPGGYRFTDYLRVGGLLNLLLFTTATLLIPRFWPS